MNAIIPSSVLETIYCEPLLLPTHDAIDRVRESMRQYFYFEIAEYAIAHPHDPRVMQIIDHAQWEKRFQFFWDNIPHHAQARLTCMFTEMMRGWDTWSPKEKEITARATMKHFLIERAIDINIKNGFSCLMCNIKTTYNVVFYFIQYAKQVFT